MVADAVFMGWINFTGLEPVLRQDQVKLQTAANLKPARNELTPQIPITKEM
jgi:hypothetical protein